MSEKRRYIAGAMFFVVSGMLLFLYKPLAVMRLFRLVDFLREHFFYSTIVLLTVVSSVIARETRERLKEFSLGSAPDRYKTVIQEVRVVFFVTMPLLAGFAGMAIWTIARNGWNENGYVELAMAVAVVMTSALWQGRLYLKLLSQMGTSKGTAGVLTLAFCSAVAQGGMVIILCSCMMIAF
jgi:hypothetical protein